ALVAHAIVGERFEELQHLRALLLVEADVGNPGPEIAAGRHVAVSRVELEDLLERRGAAGMKVRTGQLDGAKPARLEGAAGAPARAPWKQRRAERVEPRCARIVLDRAHAGTEEAERARIERVAARRRRDARRRELRSLVALCALRAAAAEFVEALLL